ncbi:hypothetical protein [Domibacillus enclensis]|uniref:Uncharacterized protein n=1 Tax=Domibacillus enclensis TaxID=1017273 RepID=A0A1N6Y140_9BACI|nr:hypothetical protein [Domibacillus enclensis]OXS77480.1 hypothetical protein B1B05_11630 [Domibacillus enclensis]SIR08256.1 hypothetical protein SAMN05443094_105115 [Domibacillus enclensis]
MNKIIYVAAAFLFLASCSQEFDVGEYVKVEHEMLGLSEPMNGGSVLTIREAERPTGKLKGNFTKRK